jgi:hypothetical protein
MVIYHPATGIFVPCFLTRKCCEFRTFIFDGILVTAICTILLCNGRSWEVPWFAEQ